MVTGNSEEEGVPKAKFFKQARLKFPREGGGGWGGGPNHKTILGGMDFFPEPDISINILVFEAPLEFPIPSVGVCVCGGGGGGYGYFHYLFIEQ